VNAPRGASQRHRSLESRLEIERLTSGLEGGCWKSAQASSSLAAYPTSRSVPRGLGGSNPAWLLGCAEHVQQFGGESPLPNLMEVKG
jgi:hypothetical protein